MEDIRIPWAGWEMVRYIDSGSYGSVYEIKRTEIEEKAAMKIISIPKKPSEIKDLRADRYSDESLRKIYKEYRDKVLNEYALMSKLKGTSNIVNCEDYLSEQHADGIGWDIYLKMELLTPLTENLSRTKTISEDTVIKLAEDLCRALVLCKEHNIIHRDIKPSNIFVSDHGDYKLGDFGIAKTAEQTMGGTVTGTYSYMAPEVMNNEEYGSAADIYSLGLVLYWLLNETRLPFLPLPPEDPTNTQIEKAKKRRFNGEKLPAPKNGSKWLKDIVLKACAYKPEDRFASAQEMLESIKAKEIISGSDNKNYGPVFYGGEYNSTEMTEGPVNNVDDDEGTEGPDNVDPLPEPPEDPKPWKKILIASAAAVLVLAVALSAGSGDKKDNAPLQTPQPKTYTTTVKYTPKPTTKPVVTPKPTVKPVATQKPGMYSEEKIQSMLSKLKDPPLNSELLNEYKLGCIRASKGSAVYGYSVHKVVVNGQSVAKPIFTISDGAEITIVGYNSGNDRYCVIVNSTNKACWVNADYVVKY